MDGPMVVLQFPFTFEDRLKAGLAVTSACPGCLIWTLAFPVVGIALPIAAYVTSGHVATSDVLLSLWLLAFMPAAILWNTWRGHKAFSDTPMHTYTISDEGVRSKSAHTEVMQDWTVFKFVRVRGGFLMLFFTKQCAHCIPLRWLDSAQLKEVGSLARDARVPRVDV